MTESAYLSRLLYFIQYGVRSRRTRLLEDQLGRADAGSWQIADRYYMASLLVHTYILADKLLWGAGTCGDISS